MAKQKASGARIEMWRNKKKEFNFRIIGKNGRVIVSANQGYRRKGAALKAIESLNNYFKVWYNKTVVEVEK